MNADLTDVIADNDTTVVGVASTFFTVFLTTFLVAFLAAFLVAFLAGALAAGDMAANALVLVPLATFLVVISSVYLRAIAARGRIIKSAFFRQRTDFGKPDPPVDVGQRPLD